MKNRNFSFPLSPKVIVLLGILAIALSILFYQTKTQSGLKPPEEIGFFPSEDFLDPLLENRSSTIIEGEGSGLGHPEGVAFSSSGDFIAVANALKNTISFFKHLGNGVFETNPFFTLKNPESQLNYPHDLSFSPDGNYLAVASSHANAVTIYKKNQDHWFDSIPIAMIKGEDSKLIKPHAIKYSPVENILAIADLEKNTVSLFRYEGDQYAQAPYQIIQNSIDILNKPDGLAFSSDGELLAITSHGNHSVLFYQQIPNSKGLYTSDPVEILQGKQTRFCFTHSISFHPSNNYLAVSSAAGKKTLCIFKKVSENFPRYSPSPVQTFEIYNPQTVFLQKKYPEEGGVKGIAFSPDGKQLGICASDIANPDKKILIFKVKNRYSEMEEHFQQKVLQ